MTQMRQYMVPDGLIGQRLDVGVSRLAGISRHGASQLIDRGDVLVDGQAAPKSLRLESTMILEVQLPPPPCVHPVPTPANFDVLYDDDDVIVINKPPGIAAHSGPGWDGPTVIGALLASGIRVSTSGPTERKGIVHRLDAGTSGAMVVAKTERAYGQLKNEFRYRRVTKRYHALVEGHPDPWRGTVDAAIGRRPGKDFRMGVTYEGKASITHYDTLEVMPGAALLSIILETGRTHQIRVHMEAIGHPVIGDPLYRPHKALADRLGLQRQWLHAVELGFSHPITHEDIRVEAPYPRDLSEALKKIRKAL
ncbi:MAG: RluA family pseudouridine synthase [Actinomycetaceae bacterium]|nr:RluA family pseudouridine synthase [Actinomycetaceae bacterium]